LFLALGPIQFFWFEQFFRTLPGEVIEAATIDGARGSRHIISCRIADGPPDRRNGRHHYLFAQLGGRGLPVLVISSTSEPDTSGGAVEFERRTGHEFSGDHGAVGGDHDSGGGVVPGGAAAGDGGNDRGRGEGMTMEQRILEARTATLAWLETMRMRGAPDGVSRVSSAQRRGSVAGNAAAGDLQRGDLPALVGRRIQRSGWPVAMAAGRTGATMACSGFRV